MNKVILLVLLMPAMAFGQIIENFEQGNCSGWIQYPSGRWNSDNSNSISGLFSLHHSYDNALSGIDLTGLPVTDLHPADGLTRWTFSIRYGCDPSSSNNWVLYLMSDTRPEAFESSTGVNGFAVGINQDGYDDTLRLWKVRNGTFYPVISSGVNWQTGIQTGTAVRISVERTQAGRWTLLVYGADGILLDSSPGTDPEIFTSAWLVLSYRYTSTRDRLLWLDDIMIEGIFYKDTKPPAITSYAVNGTRSLLLAFSEEPSVQSLALMNFVVNGGDNQVTEVVGVNPCSVILKFQYEFNNLTGNKLVIRNLCDGLNNCTENVTLNFTAVRAEPGDIIISEIMADPLPVVSLPPKEYIELLNRTNFDVNLNNWYISDGNQRYFFPEKNIPPGARLIVCSNPDTVLFAKYGDVVGLRSFPTLTDGGKILALNDSTGKYIHGIRYSPDWYDDALKSSGGWSLEMIDHDYPFHEEGNWQASLSKEGGTPGQINSVLRINPDLTFNGIENAFPEDSSTIFIKFSESVFTLDEKTGSVTIENHEIRDLFPANPLSSEFILKLYEPLERRKIYTISGNNEITDFAGNRMLRDEISFGIPEQACAGDILFNELLFNPIAGDPDYIELFNISGSVVDASRLYLVSVNDETGDSSEVFCLSAVKRCILPGEYYAVTTNRDRVIERFFTADPFKVFEVSSLPSMPDDKGHLILLSRELERIDEVFYDEEMQYSLLQENEGISLEKVRPQELSSDKTFWHSATEMSGWGTPGVANSVFSLKPESRDQVIFSSTRISPDNDGNEDLLMIDMNLEGNGNVVSISVFDETGSFVRRLTDNLLAGQSASIVWDGTDAGGRIVDNGIYILLITVFDYAGKSNKWKKVCTVLRK